MMVVILSDVVVYEWVSVVKARHKKVFKTYPTVFWSSPIYGLAQSSSTTTHSQCNSLLSPLSPFSPLCAALRLLKVTIS